MTCESSGSARGQVMYTPRERPILFSTPMVQAILEGRKTQTRRVMKPQPPEWTAPIRVAWFHPTVVDRQGIEQEGERIFGAFDEEGEWGRKSPYGAPGDRLWVRETWAKPEGRPVVYKADGTATPLRWRPSIHMPRWASRILLEVVDVRVEVVNDITVADALAEGIDRANSTIGGVVRERFQRLWDSINARRGYGWETAPWVWVVEFKPHQIGDNLEVED